MRISGIAITMVGVAGVASALVAQPPALTLLTKLPRGQWTVTADDGSPARRLCLGDPKQLVQLRHSASSQCSQYVVEDGAEKVTVQYTCRGDGFGRTSIRRETDALVRIESQGIAGGRPFEFRASARRTGACR